MLDEETLVASSAETPVVFTEPAPARTTEARENLAKKYKAMTKEEQKEFKREVKKEVKQYVKAVKKGDTIAAAGASKAMDNDLKMAIIFGAVGLIFGIIGGPVFWVLSAIAWIVAIVFFIMWIAKQ